MAKEGEGAIFRGWYVVFGAFMIMFLSFGCAYSFPAFFDSLQNEFNASRGDVSLVFSIAGGIFFGIGALSGTMADRMDPRKIIAAGIVMTGVGVIVAGMMPNIILVYIAYGLGVGFGVGFAYVPSVGPVQRWFVRRRGFASGMAVAGIGVGTFVMPRVATWLINISDWRTAYLVMGIVTIIVGLMATMLIEASPDKRGLRPDGDAAPPPPPPGTAQKEERHYTIREAIRTQPFLILYFSSFILSIPLFVPFVHLVPYAQDLNYETADAVWLVGLIGLGSIAGRFIMGSFADRLGRRQSLVAMYLGLALMFVLWLFSDAYWQLAIFAFIFGSCYGGYVALIPAVTIDYLGARSAGGLIGWMYTSVALGTFIGPAAAGYIFDFTRSYEATIIIAVALAGLASGMTLLLRDPERWRAAQAAA